MQEVRMIGIDLTQNGFQLHGAKADGLVEFRKTLTRWKARAFTAEEPGCLVATEACASARNRGCEVVNLKHDDLDFVAVSVVAPVEADLLAVEVTKTVVGDCRFVRVTPKVAQHLTRVRERGLGKDHPNGKTRLATQGAIQKTLFTT